MTAPSIEKTSDFRKKSVQIRSFLKAVAALAVWSAGGPAIATDKAPQRLWRSTYLARQRHFERAIGPLPEDVLTMLNMNGIWPGGGLFAIPAKKLGARLSVYTTFGLTNPDMPTSIQMSHVPLDADGKRTTPSKGKLQTKEPAQKRPGAAGYGYEILVVAEKDLDWPLGFLQWAVNAEIGKDVGLLARVEKDDGLTLEQLHVGPGGPINVLIAKAVSPLPIGTQLPDGRMEILVAITITEEEVRWSVKNGRSALLQKLREAGVGQVSTLGRPSVIH